MLAFEQETVRLREVVQRFRTIDGSTPTQNIDPANTGVMDNLSFLKAIFAPGVALLAGMRLARKYPLLAAIHLIPFAIVTHAVYAFLTPQILVTAGFAVTLVIYSVAAFYFQAIGDYKVFETTTRRISEGDLTAEIDRSIGGQIGQMIQALGHVNESLGQIVAQVRSSAESISTTARDIAAGHVNLSQRTQEQASTLEETAAGMEELASTVKHNAENCQSATTLAKNATTIAEKGAETVHRAVERMALIDKSSQKIVDIISTIDSIAFQTNILALNAAVEAARAGEQGRGFAVVATEVRDLAQRSAQAAKEIKTLIQDSVSNIGAGTKLVTEAGDIINDIVTSVQKVNELFGDVASASQEQSKGVTQINHAITQLDGATQQNAALVDETTAAMLAFEQETVRLREVVQSFRISETLRHALNIVEPVASPAPQTPHITAPVARTRSLRLVNSNRQVEQWDEF
jgi:methyl-accepting chemotaxis protein